MNWRIFPKRILMLSVFYLLYGMQLCAKEKLSVAVCMVEPQLHYFEEKIIKPFKKANGINITVINIEEIDDVARIVKGNGGIGLFMVPFGMAWALVDQGMVQPLSGHLSKQELQVFFPHLLVL